jgi:hypothetical protein
MKYFVHHRRGECSSYYSKLIPKNYNNTNCIVVSAKNKGNLSKSDTTFNEKTWLENSCDLQGINHISLVMDTDHITTSFISKIKYVYEYLLKSDYEYTLVSDSTDCVILKNPDDAIKLLDEYDCDILYGAGACNDFESFTMPERDTFNKSVYGNVKFNGGVCIGKVETLIKLYERVLYYADDTLSANDYQNKYRKVNGYKNWSDEKLKNFPMGVSCDQVIIKYLFMEFYPKLKLDTFGLLTNIR